MEMTKILCMKKGQDSTSYATNSLFQRTTILRAKPVLEKAIVECMKNTKPESMGIADLGCASGPNTLITISTIVNSVHSTCSKMRIKLPELRVSLNDLPNNDFNDIFSALPEFYNNMKREMGIGMEDCFVSCVGGSFHGRIFPTRSLHFVHSANSIHWLSKFPEGLHPNASEHVNEGKNSIRNISQSRMLEAYISQFEKDFFAFLRSRSEEIVEGGTMVLSCTTRTSLDTSPNIVSVCQEILAQVLMGMASEGLIEKEQIDSFQLPFHSPSREEVRNLIEREGSFSITQQEIVEVTVKEILEAAENLSTIQLASNLVRSLIEPLLESHFGSRIVDELFARYAEMDHAMKGDKL